MLFVNNDFSWLSTKIFLQKKVHHPKQPNFIIKISLKRTKLNIIIWKFFTELQLKSWAFVIFFECLEVVPMQYFFWSYKLKRVLALIWWPIATWNMKDLFDFMKDNFFDFLKVLNLTHTSFGVIPVGEAWLIYAIWF